MDLRSIKKLPPLDAERIIYYGMNQGIPVPDMLQQIQDESNLEGGRLCVMGYNLVNLNPTQRVFRGYYSRGEQILTNVVPSGTEGPLAGPKTGTNDPPAQTEPVELKLYIAVQRDITIRFLETLPVGLSNQAILDFAITRSKGNGGQHVIVGANFNNQQFDDPNQIFRAYCFGSRLLDHNLDVSGVNP